MKTVQCRGDRMNIAAGRAGVTVTEPGDYPIDVKWESSRSNLKEECLVLDKDSVTPHKERAKWTKRLGDQAQVKTSSRLESEAADWFAD
eukprot:scaffold453_cov116-Cylindrotheca_fusiformis.AAC.1